jgi:glycosyltransferase involved in cell wall biosynthesis
MRVALVAPLFESVPPRLYGGTERVIESLCHGLAVEGIETTLFASGDSLVPGELVPVIDQALRLREHPVRDPVAYNLKLLAAVVARAHEFDVIHNHHDYWMLPMTRMTRTPLLTTLHGQMDLPDIHEAFESYPDGYFVSISDHQRAPMPGLKWVRTIHHGLDLSRFEYRGTPGNYLAFLGRFDQQKRPDLAIDIAEQCGIPLKIAAKIEGPEMQRFYDSIRHRIDGRFIEYVGEINEQQKSEFLGNARALVFPIDWPEPFGLVMIEALACGTPVLARPRGATSEVLRDGLTGFVRESAEELGELARTSLDRISREDCRRWVEERFALKRMIEEYIDVYRTLRADRDRRDLLHTLERPADRDLEGELQGQSGFLRRRFSG